MGEVYEAEDRILGERVALNCGGPAFKFPESRLREEIAPRLLAAAQAIAAEIGSGLERKVA